MKVKNKLPRPLLRYHGGKFLLADWIISHFPQHKVYTEAFGGAGSVLLKKPRSYGEIYNDLDNDIVNLFKVCRDRGPDLIEQLKLTPFSRYEFNLSYEDCTDEMEKARRTVVRSFMGFGSASVTKQKTGFRSNSYRSGTIPPHDWCNYPAALEKIIERMQGIVIENRSAIEVIKTHDGPKTLHYVDPPYLPDTRYNINGKVNSYRYEMTEAEHIELCCKLQSLEGMIVLSGYENEIYNNLLKDWKKVSRKHFADGAKDRTEILWINPVAASLQNTLFNNT